MSIQALEVLQLSVTSHCLCRKQIGLLLLEPGAPKITSPTPVTSATLILNTDWSVKIPDLTFLQQSPIQFKQGKRAQTKHRHTNPVWV